MEPSAVYTSGVGSAEPNSDELRHEITRLRAELDRCESATRDVEAEKGELRGQLAEMSVQLGRARQAQEWAETGGPSPTERLRLWRDHGMTATRRAASAIRRRIHSRGQSR